MKKGVWANRLRSQNPQHTITSLSNSMKEEFKSYENEEAVWQVGW